MTSKSNPKQQIAVKIVQCTNEKAYSQALKEVQLNHLINIHPNIIFFDKIYAWSETIPVLKYFLVFSMKLAEGSLKDLKEEEINQKRKVFNEPVFINIVQQLLSTFHFLQNKELYHRDIKPENILYEKEGDKIIIRITDFGVSKALHHLKINNLKNTLVGTPLYLSPKLWDAYMNGQYSDVKHNLEKSDVFSLGITLLQTYLLLSDQQISGLNDSKQNKLPETLSKIQNDKIRELLQGMLQYDEKQRFTWQQAVNVLADKNNKSIEQALGSLNTKEQRYAISYEKQFTNKSQTIKLKMISQIFNLDQENIKGQIIAKDQLCIYSDHQIISINFDGQVQLQHNCASNKYIQQLDLQKLCFVDSIQLMIGLFSENTLKAIDNSENQYKAQGIITSLCKLKNEMVGIGMSNGEVQLIQVPQFKIVNTFHDHTAQINLIQYDEIQDLLITADLSRIFSVRQYQQFSYLKLDYVVQHADLINDQQIVVNGQHLSEILILQIINTKKSIKLEIKYTLNLQTSTVLSLINLSEKCLFVSTEKEFIIYDISLLPSEQGHLYKNDSSTFQFINWEQNNGYLFTNDGTRIIKWQIEYNQNYLFGSNRNKQQVQKKCCCCVSPCQIM